MKCNFNLHFLVFSLFDCFHFPESMPLFAAIKCGLNVDVTTARGVAVQIVSNNINEWLLASIPFNKSEECPLLQMRRDCGCNALWSFEATIGKVLWLVYLPCL